jgi:hypothetical protein
MPLLQVRDLPEPLYRRLVEEAAKERRSLSQQAIATLAKGLAADLDSTQRRKAALLEASKIDRRVTRNLPAPARLIREDRDR